MNFGKAFSFSKIASELLKALFTITERSLWQGDVVHIMRWLGGLNAGPSGFSEELNLEARLI